MEAVSTTTTPLENAAIPGSWDFLDWLFVGLLPDAQLFRYSCPGCFEFLWSLLSEEGATRPRCNCMHQSAPASEHAFASQADSMGQLFVIAYDDIPSVYARPQSIPNIHLDSIFSPTTLFMLLAKKLARQGVDPIRWIVVDPRGWTRSNKETLAVSQLLAPHLQVVDGSESVLLSVIDRLQEPVAWDTLKAQAAEDHLKLVLTAPGNRHAVSNIVGPVLLGFQPEEPEVAWIVSQLKYLLSDIGLAPAAEGNAMIPRGNERQRLRALGDIEFVLIDDQYRNGWGPIVKEALGAVDAVKKSFRGRRRSKGVVALSIHDSPEYLVSKLEQAITSKEEFRFRLRVGKSGYRNEVLLLDLRLYEASSLQEEAKFLSRVLALAQHFREHPGLPWPGFSERELTRLKTWLEAVATGQADRTDKVYLEALTLLPRVLSLTDFSLPIVIFSTTGQREITERLKSYGNIITEFEKPRLFGYQSHDHLTQTRNTFWSAIERALLLCRGRSLCAGVIRTGQSASLCSNTRANMKWAQHFELYLDESGITSREFDPDADPKRGKQKGKFVIAGLLVPYKSALERGPNTLHKKMEQVGLRWWPKTKTGPYLLKRGNHRAGIDLTAAGKYQPPNEIIEEFLKCTDPVVPAAVCLEYSEDIQIEETDNVRLQWRGDNRYRHVLSDLLELVLFDFLPALDLEPDSTLSIFVATRKRKKEDFKHREETVKRLRELFGYGGDDSNEEFRTIEESSILPILFEVLARRHPLPLGIQIEHARGVTLSYPKYERKNGKLFLVPRRPGWEPRHQHYLADLVANYCYNSDENTKVDVFEKLFDNGMYDKKDRRLGAFMLAARMIARGDLADALLAMKDWRTGGPLSATSCAAILFRNIAKTIKENLNGSDFLQLVAGLHQEKQLALQHTPFEEGSIVAFDQRTYTGTLACNDATIPFKLQSWRSATFPTLGEVVKFKRSQTVNGKQTAVSVRSAI